MKTRLHPHRLLACALALSFSLSGGFATAASMLPGSSIPSASEEDTTKPEPENPEPKTPKKPKPRRSSQQ